MRCHGIGVEKKSSVTARTDQSHFNVILGAFKCGFISYHYSVTVLHKNMLLTLQKTKLHYEKCCNLTKTAY